MASSSSSRQHTTPPAVQPLLCYICRAATVESHVVKKDDSFNLGRRYYKCPRSRVSTMNPKFPLPPSAQQLSPNLSSFFEMQISDDTRCVLDFEWHEKYKKTLEVFGVICTDPHTELDQGPTQGIHRRFAPAVGTADPPAQTAHPVEEPNLKFTNHRRQDCCSVFLLLAILTVSLAQMIIAAATYGSL